MTQTNVLSLRIARGPQGPTDNVAQAKANGHRLGATEAGLEPTPQRLELVKAYANTALRHAHAPTASQIAQRFAPRAEDAPPSGRAESAPQAAPLAPFATLAIGIRRLTAVLVVAALLPNLTLAAFWLHLTEPPWSRPVPAPASETKTPAVQEPQPALPVLSAPAKLEAAAGKPVLLPIALDGTDGVPAGSVVVIRGLPPGSILSNGRQHGETDWTLRPDEIGDLHLVPAGADGSEAPLTIELVAPNNGILADAATVLTVTGTPVPAIDDAANEAEAADAVASVTPGAATTDEPATTSEPVPLPTRRPSTNAADGPADWVRPSAYVNLREGPSSTAAVVSVVAKGAKLRIVARKRGWVQVADPATSQSGWIYSNYVETGP